MKMAAYLRVSTESQVERYGLASQRTDVQRWAKGEGHRIVTWCVDAGVSGTVDAMDRPGLACAVDAVKSGQAVGIVTPKLDRLARSLSVQEAALAHVWQIGGKFFTVETGEVSPDCSDDPMRTAMRQMVGCFAQLEKGMLVQRMRKGQAAKAAAGGYAYGAPPFGWKAEKGDLVPDEREAPILVRILDLRSEGLSTRKIADVLDQEGHKPKRAERFASATLAGIIRRAALSATPLPA